MSPPVLIVSEQLNYTKPDGIHAIFMPVIIEFSRCICTYSSAKFESKISNPKIVRRMHFNNNNKDRHFEYGDEYKRNCLIFDDIPDEIRKAYNPFDSCASAQILIKKEQKEVIR